MSIAIIICMHGQLGNEILKTSELIIGKQKNIAAIEFLAKENIDNIIDKYKNKIKELDIKHGIMFFVDIWGGSPFNAANKFLKNKNIDIITGTNIPMLIEVLMERENNQNISQLSKIAIDSGKIGIKNIQNNVPINNIKVTPKNKILNKINKNNKNMQLKLIRIDDRLIHGQVSTGWSKEFNISKIIVVNDEVAQDQIRTNLLKQVSPPGITSHIVSIDKFVRVYNNPKYAHDKVLLLFTNPKDIVRIIKQGVTIKSINIGGISYKQGKTQITDAVSLSKEDIKEFKKLYKMNVELEIRKVPNDTKINLFDKIKNL